MNFSIKLVVARDGQPVIDKTKLKTKEWTDAQGAVHSETYYTFSAWEAQNGHSETHYLTHGKTPAGNTVYCGAMYEQKPYEREANAAEQQAGDLV